MRSRLLLALAGVLLLSSCAQIDNQMNGTEVSLDSRTSSEESELETLDWANLDGMISVLVRNSSNRILRRADAIITVQNTSGDTVGPTMSTTVEGTCCTAVDIPPGGTFGFYLFAGTADAVTDVRVGYKNVAWDPAGSTGGPEALVKPVSLSENTQGAVVSADVTTTGGPIDSAVVQAVINDSRGEFLAVISGTWYCFVPGAPRRIWMQLFQELPDDSTVESVTVFPKPDAVAGGDANTADSCVPEKSEPGGAATDQPAPAESSQGQSSTGRSGAGTSPPNRAPNRRAGTNQG